MDGNYYQANESRDSANVLPRIARGDKQAVADCIDRYGNLIWRICSNYTFNRADTEDIVQEVFIDLWKNAGRFDQAKSPEQAFIVLVTRRRLIDRIRKINCLPQIHFSEIALANLANSDYKKLRQLTDEKPAIQALNKLKSAQKQIIEMAVFEGMSHREIARTVGLPVGTVKSNIRRGFQKMRRSMQRTYSAPIQN